MRFIRAGGAAALLAIWSFAPLGELIGHSESVVRFISAIGLLAGASVGWLLQYTVHHPVTRGTLNTIGWAGAALLVTAVFRASMLSSNAAMTHLVGVAGFSGALAWGLRLAFDAAWNPQPHAGRRDLLVEVARVTPPAARDTHAAHARTDESPKRVTPLPSLHERPANRHKVG